MERVGGDGVKEKDAELRVLVISHRKVETPKQRNTGQQQRQKRIITWLFNQMFSV